MLVNKSLDMLKQRTRFNVGIFPNMNLLFFYFFIIFDNRAYRRAHSARQMHKLPYGHLHLIWFCICTICCLLNNLFHHRYCICWILFETYKTKDVNNKMRWIAFSHILFETHWLLLQQICVKNVFRWNFVSNKV